MKEFKGTKSASEYIETVYGTKNFTRSIDIKDEPSLMDLMQDFSDYNLKTSKAPEMLSLLKEYVDTIGEYTPQQKQFSEKVRKLLIELL